MVIGIFYLSKYIQILLLIILFQVDAKLIAEPDNDCIYLCGNSLGLQPKTAREYVNRQFDKWGKMYATLLIF